MTKHLIDISDLTLKEIRQILLLAKKIKNNPLKFKNLLENKYLGMIFSEQSARTRLSFDIGMKIKKWGYEGINIEPSNKRVIYSESLNKIIGHVDPDGNGVEGLELYFDNTLKGVNGELTYEAAPNGLVIPQGDIKTIDRFGPDGCSRLIKIISNNSVNFQSGYLYHYAFVMLLGLTVLLTYLIIF